MIRLPVKKSTSSSHSQSPKNVKEAISEINEKFKNATSVLGICEGLNIIKEIPEIREKTEKLHALWEIFRKKHRGINGASNYLKYQEGVITKREHDFYDTNKVKDILTSLKTYHDSIMDKITTITNAEEIIDTIKLKYNSHLELLLLKYGIEKYHNETYILPNVMELRKPLEYNLERDIKDYLKTKAPDLNEDSKEKIYNRIKKILNSTNPEKSTKEILKEIEESNLLKK